VVAERLYELDRRLLVGIALDSLAVGGVAHASSEVEAPGIALDWTEAVAAVQSRQMSGATACGISRKQRWRRRESNRP
jgi:hypothetical protein